MRVSPCVFQVINELYRSSWCKRCVTIGVRECKADLCAVMNCCKWIGRCAVVIPWSCLESGSCWVVVDMWVKTFCCSIGDHHWILTGWQFRCNDMVCSELSKGCTYSWSRLRTSGRNGERKWLVRWYLGVIAFAGQADALKGADMPAAVTFVEVTTHWSAGRSVISCSTWLHVLTKRQTGTIFWKMSGSFTIGTRPSFWTFLV